MKTWIATIALMSCASSTYAQSSTEKSVTMENTKAACSDGIDNDHDGHVDCDDQDCQDLVMCAAAKSSPNGATFTSNIAERRGKATTKIVAGAVMLPLGFLIAGASAGPYYFISSTSGAQQHGYVAGGVLLDLIGVGLMAGGGTLLAIGAGERAATAPVKLAPSVAWTGGGMSVGLRGSF
jgi:hypothetical protein